MKPEPRDQSGPAKEYRNQDRFGMAVAVTLPKGTVVAPGPPRITAFEGESVRWKLLNTTKEPVTFELLFPERDPFEKGPYATSVAAGTQRRAGPPDQGGSRRGQAGDPLSLRDPRPEQAGHRDRPRARHLSVSEGSPSS